MFQKVLMFWHEKNECYFMNMEKNWKNFGNLSEFFSLKHSIIGEEHNVVFGQGLKVNGATSTLSLSLYVS